MTRSKITFIQEITVVAAHTGSEDDLMNWAACTTPDEISKITGKQCKYREKYDLAPKDEPTEIFLGGKSYIDLSVNEPEHYSYRVTFPENVSDNQFFTEVSRRICFSDCTGEEYDKIVFHGAEVFYNGWQPGMKYAYRDDTAKTIWEGEFPQWEH